MKLRFVAGLAAVAIVVAIILAVLAWRKSATPERTTGLPSKPASSASELERIDPRDLVVPRPWSIVVVGVDGMDWQIADPLMAAGRMPHLRALVERGVRADLRSAQPMLSPLLWTTMATGRRPEDHGVCDFLALKPDGGRAPIPSTFREVPALWNMAGDAGFETLTVGWWATWPAEPVRGALVSDRLAYTLLERNVDTAVPTRVAFPPDAERVALAARAEERATPGDLAAFSRGKAGAGEQQSQLRKILDGAMAYHGAATRLRATGHPKLAVIYYEMVDQVSHHFMHLAPPRREGVPAAEFATWSGAVDAAYELQDRLLGELVAAHPPDTITLLVSDHGFLNGSARPDGTADVTGKPGEWHRAYGVFVAAGGPVQPGTTLPPVAVEDIAPTVLHLLGLPLGEDMPGEPRLGLDVAPRRIATWTGVARFGAGEIPQGDEALDAAAVEQLVALGYVGSQPAANAGAARTDGATSGWGTTASYHLNKASSLYADEKWAAAAVQARLAIERDPAADAWVILGRALEKAGDVQGAAEASRRALELQGPGPGDAVHHVEVLLRAGKLSEAESFIAAQDGATATTLASRAALALHREDKPAAVRLLMSALERDAASSEALRLLTPLLEESGELGVLQPILERALVAKPALPRHREALGAIALSSGDMRAAERHLREALRLDPANAMARARLASALMIAGRMQDALVEAQGVRAAEPKDADAWVLVAAVLGRGGRPAEALTAIDRARALGSDAAGSYVTETIASLEAGDSVRARRALKEGLARYPAHPMLAEIERDLASQER